MLSNKHMYGIVTWGKQQEKQNRNKNVYYIWQKIVRFKRFKDYFLYLGKKSGNEKNKVRL